MEYLCPVLLVAVVCCCIVGPGLLTEASAMQKSRSNWIVDRGSSFVSTLRVCPMAKEVGPRANHIRTGWQDSFLGLSQLRPK